MVDGAKKKVVFIVLVSQLALAHFLMIPLLNAREQVYEADILGCFRPFEPASYKYTPDPEFDLHGHAIARWGQHSYRRLGNKVARDDDARLTGRGLGKKISTSTVDGVRMDSAKICRFIMLGS